MGAGATLYQAAQPGFFHQGSAATPTPRHPPPDNEERAGRTVAASSSSWPLAVGGKPCFLVVVLSAAWTSTSAAASSSAEQRWYKLYSYTPEALLSYSHHTNTVCNQLPSFLTKAQADQTTSYSSRPSVTVRPAEN
ncbi:hypothetical protein U9M48_037708 [Paspalum notatum var. saurae]|uniref:Uncharacterized protein n=1 Tax=Paspalum notatum var. saurae TaxID=547442 RepID=A0AAQ3XBD7_PASNO